MRSLYHFSTQRIAWIILLISAIGVEVSGLIFQHIFNLQPCVMCIYERIAFLGIVGGALVGLIQPQKAIFRWLGLFIWLFSAIKGSQLALEHIDYQLNPSPFVTCDLFVNFPEWLPLNDWAPWIFEAYGDCSEIVWTLMGYTMPQWTLVLYAIYTLIATVFIVGQINTKK
ncbi:disulfide bond formation protein DsbB [Vibrio sp.]|nr:disulfide bond formation protein DsbB [Vibrio sp.]